MSPTEASRTMSSRPKNPVLVDYWAEWCGPCKAIAPILGEIAEEYAGRLKIAKLNIDENPSTPPKYGIRGIPTPDAVQGRECRSDEGRRPVQVPALGVSRQQHLMRDRSRARFGASAGRRRGVGGEPERIPRCAELPLGCPWVDPGLPRVASRRYRDPVVALAPQEGHVTAKHRKPQRRQSFTDLPAARVPALVHVTSRRWRIARATLINANTREP